MRHVFLKALLGAIVFTAIAGCAKYEVEGDKVYFTPFGRKTPRREIVDADAPTFKALSRKFAKDRHRAYFHDKPIQGADPASFRVLKYDYSRDAVQVYLGVHPVEGAHPGSFKIITHDIARDRRSVYLGNSAHVVCHPSSLRSEGSFMIDNRCVYDRRLNLAQGLHRPSFRTVAYDVGRDRSRAYTMRPVNAEVAQIYAMRTVDDICDAASLKSIQGWLLDDECVYDHHLNRRPEVHRPTFRVIDRYHAKDHAAVHRHSGSIAGADPQTIHIPRDACHQCIRDDNRCYRDGRQVSCESWD